MSLHDQLICVYTVGEKVYNSGYLDASKISCGSHGNKASHSVKQKYCELWHQQ